MQRAHVISTLSSAIPLLLLWTAPVHGQADDRPPVTVQPGAPGEPTRVLGSDEVEALDRPTYTEADVRFIRGMIRHHAQALDMVELLRERTESEDLRRLALRIEISQEDEIALMEQWLRERNEPVPERGAGSPPDAPPASVVPGMLTRAQMDELAGTRGEAFDRLFLEMMIQHHQGALRMVERLFRSPGGGQVSSVNHIAGEVQADQAMEIERMRQMLDDRRNDR
ncbi:MAG: DUF305 domain-containing protein [Longimicrobiales bacterium]|nr:DUF305 domain-containing protein [Longimicrobiales bacterium]